ncbi:MAG: FIG01121566: hypothetical protein, partial [uncultured Solirubrobacteraceae bacterium]
GPGDRHRSARSLERRRGAPRGRAALRRLPADRPRAHRADDGRTRDGLRAHARYREGRVDLRVGAHARGRAGLRAGPRGRRPARGGGLHGHHGWRAGDHGSRQPRGAGGRWSLGRAEHRAGVRAGGQPVSGRGARVPLLLHAQGHVRPLRQRLRRLPRGLRDPRRALRGARAHPDAQGPSLPGAARGLAVLERAGRLGGRAACRAGPDLAGGPGSLPGHRRPPGDRRRLRAGGSRAGCL